MSSRLLAVLLLAFITGLPLGLTGSTLQAWMKTENIDLSVIGLFSLVGMPYALKFLWAPLMDRYVPPLLGRRRGWLLVMQLALTLSIVALAFSSPRENLRLTALLAVVVAFFSASHDIVNDAYRADVLHPNEFGLGSSLYVTGYRIAMIVSGALALMLSEYVSWRIVYAVMAALVGLGVFVTFLAPEPEVQAKPPKTLAEAVVQPFLEFFKRKGALEVISFTVLYKLDAVLTVALMTPFMMELGFSRLDIGAVSKGFGLVATIVGTLLGGALMARMSLKRALWAFGIFQAFAGLSFWALSMAGHSYPWMVTAIAVENVCSGLGNAAYAAFMLSLCNRRFSASQYALLTSLMAVTRNVLSAPAGFLVNGLGWNWYYVLCVFASVPAFLLLLRYDRWQRPAVTD
jgi:PAT family beta-lactamase induction signal transducer AmpG